MRSQHLPRHWCEPDTGCGHATLHLVIPSIAPNTEILHCCLCCNNAGMCLKSSLGEEPFVITLQSWRQHTEWSKGNATKVKWVLPFNCNGSEDIWFKNKHVCIYMDLCNVSQGEEVVPCVCGDSPAAWIRGRHFHRRRKCTPGCYAFQLQVGMNLLLCTCLWAKKGQLRSDRKNRTTWVSYRVWGKKK